MLNVLGEIGLTSTRFKVVAFDEDSSSVISIINCPISPIHSFAVTENYIIIVRLIIIILVIINIIINF